MPFALIFEFAPSNSEIANNIVTTRVSLANIHASASDMMI